MNSAPTRMYSTDHDPSQLPARASTQIVHDMVGASAPMRRVYDFIAKVAPADATVLIRGESGTGKELVARAIHRNSLRSTGPLIAVNCAAIPEHLIESELFGHLRGSFTGAVADKKGKVQLADGGTLFLDEIGELPTGLQAKVLRVLQEREFEPVGGTRPIHVNVRVIAATNADLKSSMEKGTFRQDLYFRLNVVDLWMPPLRERWEDIEPLAEHFLAKICRCLDRKQPVISPEAHACLLRHSWPGNVRELQNTIERAVVLGVSAETIRLADLPIAMLQSPGTAVQAKAGYHAAVQQLKKQLVLDAINQAHGSVTEAARALNLHPNYLHRLMTNLKLRDAFDKSEIPDSSFSFNSSGRLRSRARSGIQHDASRPFGRNRQGTAYGSDSNHVSLGNRP